MPAQASLCGGVGRRAHAADAIAEIVLLDAKKEGLMAVEFRRG
jgi:hypothetical protein